MKIAKPKILVASALLFVTACAQALQPEVLYGFQLEPTRPAANLVQGSDGNFYGTTAGYSDGPDLGSVFQVTTNGVLTKLVTFTGDNGANPQAALALGSDGNFYGTTEEGGSGSKGTVFAVTTNGMLTTLVSFTGANGAHPWVGLVLGNDGHFYGTTAYGGNSANGYRAGSGTVFKVTTNGVLTTNGILTTLASFTSTNAAGANPQAALALGSDGSFYGTTSQSGSNGYGTVFKVTTNGVLTPLVSFSFFSGERAPSGLVLGNDGSFYGTTAGDPCCGLGNTPGSIFRVTTDGALTILASDLFLNPRGELVSGRDGNLYGTTLYAGSSGKGTVLQMTTNGMLTTLASFTGTNGAYPWAGLVLGSDGNFYATTPFGGASDAGTMFRVTTNGVLTSLVSFSGTDGVGHEAGLVLGNDGNFYGTTEQGGASNLGTVFKVTTNGVLMSLVSFTGTDGAYPRAPLVLGNEGAFYGTTAGGGSGASGRWAGSGTIFRVATNGVLTSLVSFNRANGAHPQAGLVFGNDGSLYGTTSEGGPGGGGTIFRLLLSPKFTSVARQPNGSVLVTGTGPANGSYRLWGSTELSLPVASWTLLTSASFDSKGNFSYTDAGAATNPSRFYQLSVP